MKMKAAPRQPGYTKHEEYAHVVERNKEIYLSSAWLKSHWSWDKFKAFFKSLVNGGNYFVCGLPYQLAVKENLLMKDQVIDEMSEDDFSIIAWSIEMETYFYGGTEGAFYHFADFEGCQTLQMPTYPPEMYKVVKDSKFKEPKKKEGTIRFVSVDAAVASSSDIKNNDASVYSIFELVQTTTGFTRNIIYMESLVGGHTETQAIKIKQLFNDFNCDYIVLDTAGIGIGIYDMLCVENYDEERKLSYPPYKSMNNEEHAERCEDPDAEERIYSIHGNSAFNSDIALKLKDALLRGKIRTLIDENKGRQHLEELKGYHALSVEDKVKLNAPYVQIRTMINECTNLVNVGDDVLVKLKEQGRARKDRFSSVAYGNYFCTVLEKELGVDEDDDNSDMDTWTRMWG